MRRVGDVMTRQVIKIHEGTRFKDVAWLIWKHGVSGLPVVDRGGRLLGVVSEADLMLKEEHAAGGWVTGRLPWRGNAGRRNGAPLWIRRSKARGVVAKDLMTSPAVTVAPEDALAMAARIMRENGVKRLPVTDAYGDLVGIVSRSDLLTIFLRPDDETRAAIEHAVTEPRPLTEEGRIRVVVEDGVATLEGRVGSKSQIPWIVSIARKVDGVVDVVSRLEFDIDDVGSAEPSSSPGVRAGARADAWRSPGSGGEGVPDGLRAMTRTNPGAGVFRRPARSAGSS